VSLTPELRRTIRQRELHETLKLLFGENYAARTPGQADDLMIEFQAWFADADAFNKDLARWWIRECFEGAVMDFLHLIVRKETAGKKTA